ncbi:MAG: PadR family transcriptional regulator [Chloroflexales bacterium]
MPMIKLPLTIAYGLLGFVRRQPLHGYEIAQRLQATEALGLAWNWKQSQIYAELGYLEQEGYLSSSVEAQGTRPPRKVFQLTAAGSSAFTDWIARPVPHSHDFQMEFPIKLYFAQQESNAAALALLDCQQNACRNWLEDLQTHDLPDGGDQSYTQLVHLFRLSQIETILAWLTTCRTHIKNDEGQG